MVTPEIGASKEIHVPVAPPVIVDLASTSTRQTVKLVSSSSTTNLKLPHVPQRHGSSTPTFDPVETTPFLGYQPGLHATAGPLPPPPRATFAMLHTPPPPRPPRLHSPAPPRAKSDLEAVKQALQLPPSVAAKLAKTTPPSHQPLPEVKPLKLTPKRDVNTPKIQPKTIEEDNANQSSLPRTASVHRREGAFQQLSSSSSSTSRSIVDDTDDKVASTTPTRPRLVVDNDRDEHVPSVTVVEAKANPVVDNKKLDDQELNHSSSDYPIIARSLLRSPSPESGGSSNSHSGRSITFRDDAPPERRSARDRRSLSPSSVGSHSGHYQTQSQFRSTSPRGSASSSTSNGTAPSPPPKSFRNSFIVQQTAANLKRFSSLPRTPSRASTSRSDQRSSAETHYSHRSSRTPSPVRSRQHHQQRPVVRRKRVDSNPAAMFCHEVYQQRTTAERCQIYIEKINELYIHDCGLSGWVLEMKYRGSATGHPRGPSSRPFQPQPRVTSKSSMTSEATFPRRPDAVVATDLSAQSSTYHDVSPATVAVNLPYPSLATQQRQQSIRSTASSSGSTPPPSIRSLAPSNGSNNKTGFFASLGRKASMTSGRRERASSTLGHSSTSATSKSVLTKSPPMGKELSISRPILMSTTNTAHSGSPAGSVHGHGHTGPSGPRAPPNRAQRSKTLIPTPASQTYSLEREEALGRRPSLFDLNSPTGYQEPYSDPLFAEQVDKLHNVLPHADRSVLAGYLRRAGQDVLAIGQYLEDEKNGTLKYF
ncbi:hypothetical protein CC1G_00025 [Coprinopsis cinerea okayama7|uniref:Uncharacterized protein n=1 Tax=Coprinopsis cinerea (strain Okayama-7 / 130 / ATCC MYA-4618 / FGSC 9003) TaxID=240176 RepID=A8NWH0_COPC7|nr:hypothetical protein CC1G_00025 [Coprinopsis cinerea okayama7\|eukprot:XP_001836889.2 hypothetical protein CC1G_00025 [Coprinopsis cinerea okayama7\